MRSSSASTVAPGGVSATGAALLAGLAGYGAWRVPDAATQAVPGVRLRLMQPNLPQDAKFRPENRQDILDRYLELLRLLARLRSD